MREGAWYPSMSLMALRRRAFFSCERQKMSCAGSAVMFPMTSSGAWKI
jgi:hypothetical protein